METVSTEYTASLQKLLGKIDRLKAEVDALRPLGPEQEARVMQKFRLDWNYHSNSIEGNSLTYGETIAFLMEGLTAKGKPFKDHLDIKGHNEAINYLMELVKNRHQLTEKDIRDLHKMILVEPYKTPARTPDGQPVEKQVTLGAYKKMPNHVKTPTGETHYYATPEETPAKMEELMTWLRGHQEKKDLHPVIVAAIFHYRFVAIHPFDDGNGRMSRLLMNLLLLQDGYPPVIIKQQDRNAYYAALRQADAGELQPFVEFIGENLVRSLEIYLRGARGESIEEESDLDKEIALLKMSVKAQEEKMQKSRDTIYEVAEQSLIPLVEATIKHGSKIQDLFFETTKTIRVYFTGKTNFPIAIKGNNLKDARIELFKFLDSLEDANLISSISFEYYWKRFKRSDSLFYVYKSLSFEFSELKYSVKIDSKIKFSKFYNTQISELLCEETAREIIRKSLDEIKLKRSE